MGRLALALPSMLLASCAGGSPEGHTVRGSATAPQVSDCDCSDVRIGEWDFPRYGPPDDLNCSQSPTWRPATIQGVEAVAWIGERREVAQLARGATASRPKTCEHERDLTIRPENGTTGEVLISRSGLKIPIAALKISIEEPQDGPPAKVRPWFVCVFEGEAPEVTLNWTVKAEVHWSRSISLYSITIHSTPGGLRIEDILGDFEAHKQEFRLQTGAEVQIESARYQLSEQEWSKLREALEDIAAEHARLKARTQVEQGN
jgi:hypothetical protein